MYDSDIIDDDFPGPVTGNYYLGKEDMVLLRELRRNYLRQRRGLERELLSPENRGRKAVVIQSFLESLALRERDVAAERQKLAQQIEQLDRQSKVINQMTVKRPERTESFTQAEAEEAAVEHIKKTMAVQDQIRILDLESKLIAHHQRIVAEKKAADDAFSPYQEIVIEPLDPATLQRSLTRQWDSPSSLRWNKENLAREELRIKKVIENSSPAHLSRFKDELLRVAMMETKEELERRGAKATQHLSVLERPKIGGLAWKEVWANHRHVVDHVVFLNEQLKIAENKVDAWIAAGRPLGPEPLPFKRADDDRTPLLKAITAGGVRMAQAGKGLLHEAKENLTAFFTPPVKKDAPQKESWFSRGLAQIKDKARDFFNRPVALPYALGSLAVSAAGTAALMVGLLSPGAPGTDTNAAIAQAQPSAKIAFTQAASAPVADRGVITVAAEPPKPLPADISALIENDVAAYEDKVTAKGKPAAKPKRAAASVHVAVTAKAPEEEAEVASVALAAFNEQARHTEIQESLDAVLIAAQGDSAQTTDAEREEILEEFDADMDAYHREMLESEEEYLRSRLEHLPGNAAPITLPVPQRG